MDVAEISAPMFAVGLLFCHIIDEKYKELFIITPFTKNFIKLILLSNFILVCYIVVSAMNGKPNSISNVNLKYQIWRFNRDWLSMQHAILFLSTIWYLIISEIAINYNYLIIYFHFVTYTTFLTSIYSLYKRVFDRTDEVFSIELLYGDWFFIILPLTLSFIFILFKVSKKIQKIDE